MRQRRLKTGSKWARLNLRLFFLLFFFFSGFHIQPSYAATAPGEPVQILEVSKSSFSLKPGQSDYMVLTLINLSKESENVKIEREFSSADITFEHTGNLLVPSNSIVRVPVNFTASVNADLELSKGAFRITTLEPKSPLSLSVMQPFEIAVSTIGNRSHAVISKNARSPLLYLLAFATLLGLILLRKKHKYALALLLLAFGTYGVLAIMQPQFSFINRNLKTDSLDSDEIFKSGQDEEENMAEFGESGYEYKYDETESYIDLYGTALDESANTTFVYETEILFAEKKAPESELLDGSRDVDTVEASADVDTAVTRDTTENVEIPTVSSEPLQISGPKIFYETDFGIQTPIRRRYHTEYQGLEIRVLAFLMPQNINRNLIRKQTAKALEMKDGVEMRLNILQTCRIMQKDELSTSDRADFENILLHMLSESKVSSETVHEYAGQIFEDPLQLMHENASSICDDFDSAHKSALAALQPNTDAKATKNVDQTEATNDAAIIIATTSENTVKKDEIIEVKRKKNVKNVTQQTDGEVRTFSLFDLPDPSTGSGQSGADGTQNTAENISKAESEPVQINLDLTESDLIEMIIPNRIELPPLARQNNAYNSRNSMGDFQIRTFKNENDWRGFFSFEVIKLGDGETLDEMWLEIDGEKILPEKSVGSGKKYLNYQLASDMFQVATDSLYNFEPYIWINVPAKAAPGTYNSDISFTLIQ